MIETEFFISIVLGMLFLIVVCGYFISQIKNAKSEQNVPTHKEFQKAIDKAGLRGYKFKDSEVKE